jgi:hypothetical protein
MSRRRREWRRWLLVGLAVLVTGSVVFSVVEPE